MKVMFSFSGRGALTSSEAVSSFIGSVFFLNRTQACVSLQEGFVRGQIYISSVVFADGFLRLWPWCHYIFPSASLFLVPSSLRASTHLINLEIFPERA